MEKSKLYIDCPICGKTEELGKDCLSKIEYLERKIESFWRRVDKIYKRCDREKEQAWAEHCEKYGYGLFDWWGKRLRKKYLYPKLEEIEKKYDELIKQLDWDKLKSWEEELDYLYHKSIH